MRFRISLQVLKLPADPNIVTILEGYVKNCAVNQLCGIGEKPQRRYRYHHYQNNKGRDLERACRRYRHTASQPNNWYPEEFHVVQGCDVYNFQ